MLRVWVDERASDAESSTAVLAPPRSFRVLASADNQRMVRRYVAALSRDREAVDDLAQEVFVRALERVDRLVNAEKAGAFLRGIARRVVQEHFRQRRRDRRYEAETAAAVAGDAVDVPLACHDRAMLDLLLDAIDALPVVSRRLIEMRYHDGLNASDIATALGIQPTAVRVSLLRIRERLKRRVESAARSRRAF